MNWEETILYVRQLPEYKELIRQSYLEEDLKTNVEHFEASVEFSETLKLIHQMAPHAQIIADIGAGNGMSSIALARKGFIVKSIEPDSSATVGWKAIEKLKIYFQLPLVTIYEATGENLPLESESIDIVYIRQAMHHAGDLDKFISEAARVLKKNGLLLTIRDHVIFDSKDKIDFLRSHPLQKYYGGENAFSHQQYSAAINKAGFSIKKILKHFESPINYYPFTEKEAEDYPDVVRKGLLASLNNKIGMLSYLPFIPALYLEINRLRFGSFSDERRIPGRMYSFIATKN